MKPKKITSLLLAIVMAVSMLAGCSSSNSGSASSRIVVSVDVKASGSYSQNLYENLTPAEKEIGTYGVSHLWRQ